MFFFKKRKPTLYDLIPERYVDIHNHVLYGLDDGATDWQHSEQLLQQMQAMRFDSLIMTPHIMSQVWENTPEKINDRFEAMTTLYSSNAVQLRYAAEYMMDDQFHKRIYQEKLLPLKDNLVLVEMSYHQAPLPLYDILFELQVEGYQPVLAHPERYNFFHGKMDQYKKLKKAGCLFQLNLVALTGYYGFPVTKTAELLLNEGMYDFTGSDVHHQRHIDAFKNQVCIKQFEKITALMEKNEFFR